MGVYYSTELALFYINRLYEKSSTLSLKPQILSTPSLAGYDAISYAVYYTAAKSGVRGIWKAIRRPYE